VEIARMLKEFGLILSLQDRSDEAIRAFQETLAVCQAAPCEGALAHSTEFALAKLCQKRGRSREAVELARRALVFFRSADPSAPAVQEIEAWMKSHSAM